MFRRMLCFRPVLQTALKLTPETLTSDPSALRPLSSGGSLESYGLRSCTSEPLLANVKVTTACGHLMLEPAICYIPHHPSGHKVILVLRTKLGGSFDVVLGLRMPLRMDCLNDPAPSWPSRALSFCSLGALAPEMARVELPACGWPRALKMRSRDIWMLGELPHRRPVRCNIPSFSPQGLYHRP